MKKRIRIKDIADKAGVSTGTVDRVIHNRGKVAETVKKRVLEVMDELGYERNLIASALAYNKQVRVVVLLPKFEQDPFWKQTDEGIQKASKSVQNYGLLIDCFYFDAFSPDDFVVTAKGAMKEDLSGLLFPPIFLEEAKWLSEECAAKKVPTVLINTQLENVNKLCYIGQDSYQSGVLAARLLDFTLQSEQAICILNLDFNTASAKHLHKKEKGFRAYFEQKDRQDVEIVSYNFEDFQDSQKLNEFLAHLIQKHKNLHGIFVTNSRAYNVVTALTTLKAPPIKLVGFDLVEANLAQLETGNIQFLINQNPMEQGYEGVMSLFKHLILKEAVEKIQYLPLDIVVKENVPYYLQRAMIREIV